MATCMQRSFLNGTNRQLPFRSVPNVGVRRSARSATVSAIHSSPSRSDSRTGGRRDTSRIRKQAYPGDKGWDPLKLRSQQPKVFNQFREIEIIHARWAMLGVLALIFSDMAGQPFYPLPQDLSPATFASIASILLLLLGLIETYRMRALWDEEDFEARAYPGKRFDVLGITKRQQQGAPPGLGVYSAWVGGLAGWLAGGWWFQRQEMTEGELLDMKTKELKNGRLAMISFLGCCLAGVVTGKGPYTLLVEHISDPMHNHIIQQVLPHTS